MATLDVKNTDGNDTGNSENGRVVVRTAKAGAASLRKQTLEPTGFFEFSVAGFDTSPPGCVLKDRLDDPRYYTGDAAT